MAEILTIEDLPLGFDYPTDFIRMSELGLLHLEPWHVLEGEPLRAWLAGLRQRYPRRTIVPFAHRQDCDDVACFDLDLGGVSIVHDFASEGDEQIGHFHTFEDWLRQAFEDFVQFEKE